MGEEKIKKAEAGIVEWLGEGTVSGKNVVDIRSGSGMHSLAFVRLHARRLLSLDYDRFSVEALDR